MAQFRKRAAVIEAVQFTGDNAGEIEALTGLSSEDVDSERRRFFTPGGFTILGPGEWLIRSGRSFSPCDAQAFAVAYEPVGGAPEEGNSVNDQNDIIGETVEDASKRLLRWPTRRVRQDAAILIYKIEQLEKKLQEVNRREND